MSVTSTLPAVQMLSASTTDFEERHDRVPGQRTARTRRTRFRSEPTAPRTLSSTRATALSMRSRWPASGSNVSRQRRDNPRRTAANPRRRLGHTSSPSPWPTCLAAIPRKALRACRGKPGLSLRSRPSPAQTASFRVYTIGIVTHGGIQDPSWKHGPPWQLETAYMMRHEGFDSVIAYNWVQQEQHPGRGDQAVAQACADDPRMPRERFRQTPRSTSISSATVRERWSTLMPS